MENPSPKKAPETGFITPDSTEEVPTVRGDGLLDQVVSTLAFHLLDAELEDIPSELHRALAGAGGLIGAERLFFYRLDETEKQLKLLVEWKLPGQGPIPDMLPVTEETRRKWIRFRALTFAGSVPIADDAGGSASQEALQYPLSELFFPLRDGQQLSAVLGLVLPGAGRCWSIEEIADFHEFGTVLTKVTRRLRTLEILHRETHLLSTLMQNLPDAIYFKDRESRFLRVSRQIVEQNGLHHSSEIIGKTDFDLFTLEHASQAYTDEQEIMRTGQPIINKEEKETWPDGRVTWVLTTKMPFRDSSGNIIGIFGISTDITQLRLTQSKLNQSQEMLRQGYLAMEQDIEHARLIQRALLPHKLPQVDYLRIAFRYEPLEAVGGDFFSFKTFDDGSLGVFVGDLTGHGVSAALFMSLVKCTTERIAHKYGQQPKKFMEQLDAELRDQIPNGFLTAIYMHLRKLSDGSVMANYVGAGHPEPVLCRAGNQCGEFVSGGVGALGLFENYPRTEAKLILLPGDKLYLYTDGIPETCNAAGTMLGTEGLTELFHEAGSSTIAEGLDSVLLHVKAFQGSTASHDDIALLGFEVC